MAQTTTCRICQNSENNRQFQIKEMMFGIRDTFTYFQCAQCQCLQIADHIEDLSPYYPTNYFDQMSDSAAWPIPAWSATMGAAAVTFQEIYADLHNKDWEKIITEKVVANYLDRVNISKDATILDVGAADAMFLRALRQAGFTNTLLGIDPYKENKEFEDGVILKKATIFDLANTPTWDLITFNHSFEHLADPHKALQAAANMLKPDGICLIRIPVVPCYAWQRYGVNWVSIDAPRHYFIPSPDSINILATKSGLELFDTLYDSTAIQFLASEQYARDIPFYDKASWTYNPFKSMFTFAQVGVFDRRSQQLNAKGQGEQAAFYLRKAR